MSSRSASPDDKDKQTNANIAYIRQMLAELRQVAHKQGADMLCYLIEMAYVEAGDIQTGRRTLSIRHQQGNHSPGVSMQPAGDVELQQHKIDR